MGVARVTYVQVLLLYLLDVSRSACDGNGPQRVRREDHDPQELDGTAQYTLLFGGGKVNSPN
jgi:hypothetical protein